LNQPESNENKTVSSTAAAGTNTGKYSTMGAAVVNNVLNSVDEKGYVNGHVKSDAAEAPYVVSQDHIHKKRLRRVICIGAGIAGIAAAYKYQQRLSNVSFSIYEKNHDVGGTWLENRYPGCACDIPAHGYTYSWEGNPDWSRLFVCQMLRVNTVTN
jgi:heterodisulfide reductase subunit A-like polyferredoxin